MFMNAGSFNQNISGWNVSNFRKISNMFRGAVSFNQKLDWDLCHAEEYDNFDTNTPSWDYYNKPAAGYLCYSFVSVWNTSKTSPGSTDSNTIKLPLYEGGNYDFTVHWGDTPIVQGSGFLKVTEWDSPNATKTYDEAGEYVVIIDGTLEGFRFNNQGDRNKLINITKAGSSLSLGNKGSYFYGAENLENIPESINLTSTTNLSSMFRGAYSFNANISRWVVSKATKMDRMFQNATIFSQSLNDWGC